MRGIVTILVRDVNTNEVIDEVVQQNVITENFLKNIFQHQHVMFKLDISDAIYKPSIYNTGDYSAANGRSITPASGAVFGVPQLMFIGGTGSTLPMLQYASRFAPPTSGTTRTIKTVRLSITGGDYIVYQGSTIAFAELAVPCVQTDSQIYDIYYRILLDYTEVEGGLSESAFLSIFETMCTQRVAVCGTSFSYAQISPFPKLVKNSGDNVMELFLTDDAYVLPISINPSDYVFKTHYNYFTKNMRSSTELDFPISVGSIQTSYRATTNPVIDYFETQSTNLFSTRSKIQNVFGFNTDGTNPLSEPFLDVDNLATGSGNIVLTGDWQDTETTSNPALYFKTLLPRRGIVTITKTGAVGVAEYKYSEQLFLGYSHLKNISKHYQICIPITPLTSVKNPLKPVTHNKSLLGDIGDEFFSVEQLSAVTSYDGSSVIIPKKSEIVLYSIAGSRYWKITGSFTNIHQIAVVGDDIYIACRATGLYKVNPRVSLVAAQVVVPGADLSECNGVCVGYGNKLWALGKDALVSYFGGSWLVYNDSSTPLFTTDPSIYSRVGYIKADKETAGDKLVFVYKNSDASTKLGFFWSPTTPLLETATQPSLSSYGRPKLNKTHLELVDNNLVVVSYSGSLYTVPFNSSAAFTTTSGGNETAICSLVLMKTGAQNVFVRVEPNTYREIEYNAKYTRRQSFYASNAQLLYSQPVDTYGLVLTEQVNRNRHYDCDSTVGGYRDKCAVIHLESGVVFEIKKYTTNNSEFTFASIYQLGLDYTPHGGNYRSLTRKEYGWNGTAWELGNPNSKVAHTAAEPIINGVNIAFTNGTTGTSFAINNFYKFGLSRGLMKDNATRAQVVIPTFFSKTANGNPILTSNVVPSLTALPTGVVGVHSVKRSKDAFLDANNQVTFPGETGGQFAVGDKQVTGDFEISFSCAPIADTVLCNQKTIFGVGKSHLGPTPMIGIGFVNSTTAHVRINTEALENTNNFETHVYTISGLTSASTVGIKRVGSSFFIMQNGAVVHTIATSPIRPADKRLDIMFGTYRHHIGSAFRPANTFCPATTIISNGSDNVIKFGNAIAGSEAFDINCKGVVPELPVTATLDGVNAPVNLDGTLPVPGTISLDKDTMCMVFDPADEGKTVTINCTRIWNM